MGRHVAHSPLTADRSGGHFNQLGRGSTSVHTPGALTTQALTEPDIIAVNVQTFTVDLPALAAGATADVPFEAPLGLPSFTLSAGVTGFIDVNLTLVQLPTNVLIDFSQQLSYGGVPSSNQWSIPAGGTFAGGKAPGVVRAYAFAAAPAQTITILCASIAYGIQPLGGA